MRSKYLEIVGLDVRPDLNKATQTGDLRLAEEFSERGRQVYQIYQACHLLRAVRHGLSCPLWKHLFSTLFFFFFE